MNEHVRRSRLKSFDGIVEDLREYIAEERIDSRSHASFLLGRLHRILGEVFDREAVANEDSVRIINRGIKSFNGEYFLYLDGVGVLERGIDEEYAANLISIILGRYSEYEREKIARKVGLQLDRIDEESAYLRRMEEEDKSDEQY